MKKLIVLTLSILLALPMVLSAQQEKNDTKKPNELSLLLFKGEFKEKFIHLKWSPLATPQDIKVYQIEYSQDGKTFKSIGKVYPELINVYKFKSIVYHAGANYFRIIQVGNDGSTLESYKINVMCGFQDRYMLELNKLEKQLKLTFQVRNTQQLEAEVLDAKGQVKHALFSGEMMENEIIFRAIDVSDWEAGTYYVSLRGESFRENREIVIL